MEQKWLHCWYWSPQPASAGCALGRPQRGLCRLAKSRVRRAERQLVPGTIRMYFEILGEIAEAEVIARGSGLRRLKVLRKRYGGRNWRKLKGVAEVRLGSGTIRRAEIHWYEAHSVGRKGWKIRRFLD